MGAKQKKYVIGISQSRQRCGTAVNEKSDALSLTTAEQLGVRRSSHQDFGRKGVNSIEGGLETTNMAIT